MSRAVVTLDRVAAGLLGLVLVLGGLGVFAWSQAWLTATGRLHRWLTAPDAVSLGHLRGLVRDGWWPWVAALVGIGLLVTAGSWLLAHLPAGRVRRLTVTAPSASGAEIVATPGGSAGDAGTGGRLTADTAPLARAAAARLRRFPDIASVGAELVRDRGELVAEFRITAAADVDLAAVARRIDTVCSELLVVTQDPQLRARARIRVKRASDA